MDGDQAQLVAMLRGLGLVGEGEQPIFRPLSGGVSSEIWAVETQRGTICIKRAMPRLRVAALWEAPVERNHAEAEWLRVMGELCPGVAPQLLGELREAHCFAMPYLDPARHPLWKQQLQRGVVSVAFARSVGTALGRMHASTAGQDALARRFATDANFHALRIEPYLEATGRAHPPLAPRLAELAQATVTNKRVLVHGDASPKNILAGPSGPIFLDAECAWYGDPAFDAAFVLNHLLLKCLLRPDARQALLDSFAALADHYLDQVTWEDRGKLEMRIAALLPGLLLARVDGKSPVEYVTDEADKNRVRRIASELLRSPVPLRAIVQRWAQELSR